MRKIVKRVIAFVISACMVAGNIAVNNTVQTNAEETKTYDFSYEDLFLKAPKYLFESSTAEYITTMCTNAQADGLEEISKTDTMTAALLEALNNGESYIFNTIFGITTESKAERMEDDLVQELLYEYSQTSDSYLRKVEDITSHYKKYFNDVIDDLGSLSKAEVTERLQKANQTFSKSDIKEMVDAGYENYDKFVEYGGTAIDFVETFISMVEIHEIEATIIEDLLAVLPQDSSLINPLYRLSVKINQNAASYFINNYLVDEVISYISKTITKGAWAKGGTATLIVKACIGITALVYNIFNPTVSDIVQANLAYSYTRQMENAVTDLQLKFLQKPEEVDEQDIEIFETAYSFYLTALRTGMLKIAKATSKRMASRLNLWADLAGEEGGLTYEVYIDGCMNKLQSDIDSGIFKMPEETAKESVSNGNQAIGTIVSFNPRVSQPSTSDYHYYNVSGCQNPYALTGTYGMPNCTAYAFGRAWELASDDWLQYKDYFTGNANTYWTVNENNKFFPSGQVPQVGAIVVYGSNGFSSVGHVAVVENTDEMYYDEATGRYYGYYISHSSYGGFTWAGNNPLGTNNSVFHYDKVTDSNWENSYIGCAPLGFIYVYSGQGYDDSVNFVVENGVLVKYNGWQANVVIPEGVTAIGDQAFYDNANIQTVTIPDSVTSIGNEAFKYCTNLRCIEIPDSVKSIGYSAFEECIKLASVGLPFNAEFSIINNSTFYHCVSLKRIDVPNSVTEIGSKAFYECENLSEVTLPKALINMGSGVFYNCDKITSIEIPKSLENCDSGLWNYEGPFASCSDLKNIVFEQGITEIAINLFNNCDGLEQIEIPDSVTKIESYAFYQCRNLTSIKIPDSVTEIERETFYQCINLTSIKIPDSVTDIGSGAFSECENLSEVTLSKSLEELGNESFGNCDKITSIEIPKSLKICHNDYDLWGYGGGAFNNCDGLKEVIFEEGTTQIATKLFYNCTGLEKIEIPDTVTIVEGGAFYKCKNLISIEIPDSVTVIGSYAFYECEKLSGVTLSKSLEELGNESFGNCDKITSIEIPKSLKICHNDYDLLGYGGGAFDNCDGLKEVIFEEGTTQIATKLFYNCTGLERIEIPDTVMIVESGAFYNCSNLNMVILCDGLKEIESSAFANCTSLTDIKIPNSVEDMGTYIFSGCTALKYVTLPNTQENLTEGTFKDCTALTEIALPDSLKAIQGSALENCDALTNITIPEGVTTIESYAFYDCDALTSVIIPEGTTDIGSSAFEDCDALTTVVLSDTVKTIGNYIFKSCDMLTDVTLGASLTSIPYEAFMDCASLCKLVVPYRVETIDGNAFKNATKLTAITIPKSVTSIDSTAFSYPKKITISGVSDSYANTFAKDKGITFMPLDVPANEIKLNITELNIYPYKSVDLLAIVKPLDYTGDITFVSSDEEIVSVTMTGKIRAEKTGSALITVTAGDKTANCRVNVLVPVDYISVENTYETMYVNTTHQLVWEIIPDNAYNKNVVFIVNDEEIATVDENGLITANKAGTTRIYIISEDGQASRSIYLTVEDGTPEPAPTQIVMPEPTTPASSEPGASIEPSAPASSEPGQTFEPIIPVETEPGGQPFVTVTPAPPIAPTAIATPTIPPTTPDTVVPPVKLDKEQVISVDELTETINKIVTETVEKVVKVITDSAPVLQSEIFDKILETNKNISVSVTDEQQNLLYSWSFNNRTLVTIEKDVDLSLTLSVENEIVSEIKQTANVSDVLFMQCGYDGDLPGTADVLAYVGEQYTDEQELYLYNYDQSSKEVKRVSHNAITVNDGYVDFQLNKGATYFFSTELIEEAEPDEIVEKEWLYGDVNLDEKVNLQDAQLVLKAALGIENLTGVAKAAADANLDGKITLQDAQLVLKAALGICSL